MAGLLSKDITLAYGEVDTYANVLTNLQEIPEIGNGAPEKVEVTVLTDASKKYIAGLTDGGQDLSFKFLYEKAQFSTLAGLTESQNWKLSFPGDTLTATFKGTPSVKMDGVGVNAPLTYTLTIVVEDAIAFA